MVGIGIVDDLKGLSAPVKLAGQILAATTMTLGGVQVLFFWLPGFGPRRGRAQPRPELGIPFTVLLVIVFVNAVNLVDGLDGLAAGLVAIGACAYFVYSYRTGGHRPDRPGLAGPAAQAPCCSGCASASCPTTSTRPASSWATPAPCCWGPCWPGPPSPASAAPPSPRPATSSPC